MEILKKLLGYVKMPFSWAYGLVTNNPKMAVGAVAAAAVAGAGLLWATKNTSISNVLPENTTKPISTQIDKITKSGEPAKAVTIDMNGIRDHFYKYHEVALPKDNVVTICSAHSCQNQTRVRLNDSFMSDVSNLLSRTGDAKEEREALKKAVALFETYVGKAVGTSKDRPGMDLAGSGDKTQLDSVDETTNVTSLLIVLANKGLIKYHNIKAPYWMYVFPFTNRYGALIQDISTERHWIIDSSLGVNGDEPLILEYQKWSNL